MHVVDAVLNRIKFLLGSSRLSNLTFSRIVESCLKFVNDRFSKGGYFSFQSISKCRGGFL